MDVNFSFSFVFYLAISNKRNDGSNINVFKAVFTYDPSVDRFFDDMEAWCKNTLQEVNDSNLNALVKTVQEAPMHSMTDLYLNSSIHFTDVSIDTVSYKNYSI